VGGGGVGCTVVPTRLQNGGALVPLPVSIRGCQAAAAVTRAAPAGIAATLLPSSVASPCTVFGPTDVDGCTGFEDEGLAGDVIGTASGLGTALMVANTVGAANTEGIEGSGGGGSVGAARWRCTLALRASVGR
jgi:hypothetical protein